MPTKKINIKTDLLYRELNFAFKVLVQLLTDKKCDETSYQEEITIKDGRRFKLEVSVSEIKDLKVEKEVFIIKG